jgi:hypothetical protein
MARVALLPVCIDVTEFATVYQDGALGWREQMSIRLHLLRCTPCTRFYDQMRRTAAFVRDRGLSPPDEAATDALLRGGNPDAG